MPSTPGMVLMLCWAVCAAFPSAAVGPQIVPARVQALPAAPNNLAILDWQARATAFAQYVFTDPRAVASGLFARNISVAAPQFNGTACRLQSYLGGLQPDGQPGEALALMGAVLTGLLVNVSVPEDCLKSVLAYVSGEGVVWNNPPSPHTPLVVPTFWYSLANTVFFTHVLLRAGNAIVGADEMLNRGVDAWYRASVALGGTGTVTPDYTHTGFDFGLMRAVDNGQWTEGDCASVIAWFGLLRVSMRNASNTQALQLAQWALGFLDSLTVNPLYETLLPFGVRAAAVMNALQGSPRYNVSKLLEWSLGDGVTVSRPGWGMLGQWAGQDVGGLVGSITDGGGYAFFGNSAWFTLALAPVPIYAREYALAIGKWLLAVVANSRFFYGDQSWQIATTQQCNADDPRDPLHVVAYEGLRACAYYRPLQACVGDTLLGPFATGDVCELRNCSDAQHANETDLGVYGGAHVGVFAALVQPTNVSNMPAFDLSAVDVPLQSTNVSSRTWLVYNPNAVDTWVDVSRVVEEACAGAHGAALSVLPQASSCGVTTTALFARQRDGFCASTRQTLTSVCVAALQAVLIELAM